MDFHPAVWASGTWGNKQYGIPIYVTTEAMAVRKDLFSEYELKYPRTFEQVIETGRKRRKQAKREREEEEEEREREEKREEKRKRG